METITGGLCCYAILIKLKLPGLKHRKLNWEYVSRIAGSWDQTLLWTFNITKYKQKKPEPYYEKNTFFVIIIIKEFEKSMDAVRYIQKITADSLTIEVSKYRGKNVEIIIIPLDDKAENQGNKQFKSVKGALHKYSNPSLIDKEKTAWQDAIKRKYGIH